MRTTSLRAMQKKNYRRQDKETVPSRLEVVIVLVVGQRHAGSGVHLLPVLLEQSLVNLGGGGSQSGGSDEFLGALLVCAGALNKEQG